MPRARKQDSWTYICGEKGVNRVRVYTHRSGTLFAEYRRNGIKIRDALGHGGNQETLAGALRALDLPHPISDWQTTWDGIRARVVDALRDLRREVELLSGL